MILFATTNPATAVHNGANINRTFTLANGAAISYPSLGPLPSGTDTIPVPTQPGAPMIVAACSTPGAATTFVKFTFPDRTSWCMQPGSLTDAKLWKIVDRNGNAIVFNYAGGALQSIRDGSNNQPLLTIVRAPNQGVVEVYDCYNRAVYYHESVLGNYAANPNDLDGVSQIVPTCTANPPMRYSYGYVQLTSPSQQMGKLQFLHTISVPSPTGNGLATATINYDPSTEYVTSIFDANGISHWYSSPTGVSGGSNSTIVTVRDASNNVTYQYAANFDNNMSGTAKTDGAGNTVDQVVFADPNDPYKPSLELDGNACASHPDAVAPAGQTGNVVATGTAGPSTGTWDIVNPSAAVIATSVSPGAWTVTLASNGSDMRVSVPASTAYANGYTVRYIGVHRTMSALFDVISPYATYGTTQYSWDQFGNETSETSPRGTVTIRTWDYSRFALGELMSVKEGSKLATTFTYDEPSGNVTSFTSPAPGTIGSGATTTRSFTYDKTSQGDHGLGNVLTETMPGNNAASTITTTYNYTADPGDATYNIPAYSQTAAIRHPLQITDALGHTTHCRFDALGNQNAEYDPLGNLTTSTYNIDSRALSVVFPATGQSGASSSSDIVAYMYNLNSNTSVQYGPLVSTSHYDEGAAGLVRRISLNYGPEGESVSRSGSLEPYSMTYDSLYRRQSLTDGGGGRTTYNYTTLGLLYQVCYPGSTAHQVGAALTAGSYDTSTCTQYDRLGNPLTIIDGNGTTETLTYSDPESKLTNVHTTAGSGITAVADDINSYDAYGRKIGSTDNSGTYTTAFDDNNDVLQAVTTYNGVPGQAVAYQYYPDGSRNTMGTPAGTFSYLYDAAGRAVSMRNPLMEVTNWTYLNNDWLKTQTTANGTVATYSYDALGKRTSVTNSLGATVLSAFSASFDGANNIAQISATGTGFPFPGLTSFQYDNRSELTQETSNRASGYTNIYHYDAVTTGTTSGPGNPTTVRGQALSYSANGDNQIANSGFSFDGNGSPIAYNGVSIGRDANNQISTIGSAVTNKYRADGIRSAKSSSAGAKYFIYDGEVLICEVSATGTVLATNTNGVDGLVSRADTVDKTYTYDLAGSVAQRVGPTGIVFSSDMYDASGNVTSTTSPDVYEYNAKWGYYSDTETGLRLLRRRFYDSSTGRFFDRDPLGYNGGINLYQYCSNNPVNYSDPSGLLAFGNSGGWFYGSYTIKDCRKACCEIFQSQLGRCYRKKSWVAFDACMAQVTLQHAACMQECSDEFKMIRLRNFVRDCGRSFNHWDTVPIFPPYAPPVWTNPATW